MTRWLAALCPRAGSGAATLWLAPRLIGRVAPPIRVGILHSETGADGDQREIDDRRRDPGA